MTLFPLKVSGSEGETHSHSVRVIVRGLRGFVYFCTVIFNVFCLKLANGALGDGKTDDHEAFQRTINDNVNGKIVYIPAGSYVIGDTVNIPPGTRIIGETWSVIMAGGSNVFQNEMAPVPMFKVGEPGQTGSVEITDLMFSTKGAQPGAILVQWNIKESSQGSAAMWDSHFRVGGFAGSDLQVAKCPKGQGYVPECVGAHTLLHLTPSSSGYFENVWAWTADHDLEWVFFILFYDPMGWFFKLIFIYE